MYKEKLRLFLTNQKTLKLNIKIILDRYINSKSLFILSSFKMLNNLI